MPRYPSEHKSETRRRILDTAGRRFKRDGIDGSGVAILMSDAGLTNGAFYSHFKSKADLVAAVIADQMEAQVALVASIRPGRAGMLDYIEAYLSPQHRDDIAEGCPSAALLDEIGRCEEAPRRAYDVGARALIEGVAARLAEDWDVPADVAWGRAAGLYSLLVSTLQLSRAVVDPDLSASILAGGIDSALALTQTPA